MKTLKTALIETVQTYEHADLLLFIQDLMEQLQSNQLLQVAQRTFIENDPLIAIELDDRTVDINKLSLIEIIKSTDPVDIFGKIVQYGYPSQRQAHVEWTGMSYADMHQFKVKVNSLLND